MCKKKTYSAADGYRPQDLIHAARDHLFAAQQLFGMGVSTLDSAGYLSQLGVELLLKAILLNVSGSFPNEHSLDRLCKMVKECLPSFKIAEPYSDVLPCLERFYQLRYPTPKSMPGVAQGDWPVIEHIANLIEQYLPETVRCLADTDSATQKSGRRIIRRREDVLSNP